MKKHAFLMLFVGMCAVPIHAKLWVGLGGRLGTFGPGGEPYHETYNRGLTGGGYLTLLHKTGLGVEWAVDYYSQKSSTEAVKKLSILPLTFGLRFSLMQTEPIILYVGVGTGDYFITEGESSSSEIGYYGVFGLNFFFREAGGLVFEVRKNTVNYRGGDLGGWGATLGLTFTLFPQKPTKSIPEHKHRARPTKPYPKAAWSPGRWKYMGPKRGYVWVSGHWKTRRGKRR